MTAGNRHWELILAGKLPDQGPIAEGDLSFVQTLARRWKRMGDIFLEHRKEMTLLRYEDFAREKSETIRNTASALGLRHSLPLDGLVDVQYQPKGDSSTNWLDFFGPTTLRQIDEICSDTMEKFGYAKFSTR